MAQGAPEKLFVQAYTEKALGRNEKENIKYAYITTTSAKPRIFIY